MILYFNHYCKLDNTFFSSVIEKFIRDKFVDYEGQMYQRRRLCDFDVSFYKHLYTYIYTYGVLTCECMCEH